MSGTKESLEEVVQQQLEVLKNTEVGSDEYFKITNNVVKLLDKLLEFEKGDMEELNYELNSNIKTRQMDLEETKFNSELELKVKEVEIENNRLELETVKVNNEMDTKSSELTLNEKKHSDDHSLKQQEFDLKNKEFDLEVSKVKFDEKIKKKELWRTNREFWISRGFDLTGIIVPSLISVWGIIKSLQFEETGSITSIAGRGLFNKVLK